MVTVSQIRVMIQELYLLKISLDDFEEWLTAASWNMHKDPSIDDETRQMVGAIELSLSESEGEPDSEVINRLAFLAGIFRMGPVPLMTTGASVGVSQISYLFGSSADADRQPEMVFG